MLQICLETTIKNPCLKVHNLQHKFLELFRKFIRFGNTKLVSSPGPQKYQSQAVHFAILLLFAESAIATVWHDIFIQYSV